MEHIYPSEAIRRLEEKRLSVIDKHLENGVLFLGVDGVVIDEEVLIGKGTQIYPNVILRGKTVIGENCVITSGSLLENCKVGDRSTVNASQCYDSVIHDDVKVGPFSHLRPHTELADHVKIGDFVELKNSFLDVGASVAHLSYIGDTDIGRNVNVGGGVITVNYDGVNKFRCKVGDGAFIGCNTNLIAPVTVGDNVFIAAGSTITDDLSDGDFAIARARQVVKPGLGEEKLKDRKLKY